VHGILLAEGLPAGSYPDTEAGAHAGSASCYVCLRQTHRNAGAAMNHYQRRSSSCPMTGAAVCIAIALAGCSWPPSADVMFGGVPRSAGSRPPAAGGGLNGLYVGTADIELNGNLACPDTMPITNFEVTGDVVRFGAFAGPIAPDGTVSLRARGMVFNGRFTGSEFNGRVDTTSGPDVIMRPLKTCLYAIRVHRLSA